MLLKSNPLRKHDQMANFQDILNRPSEEIKPAPTLPMGSYHSIVVGLPEQGESSKKKTPFLKFTHKIIAPLDDVDPDAITEFEAEGETIVGQEIENTLYVTDKSANMLKEFLINCGVDLTGRSMAEGLDEVPNAEVIINIKHEASDDGKRVYSKVVSTARVRASRPVSLTRANWKGGRKCLPSLFSFTEPSMGFSNPNYERERIAAQKKWEAEQEKEDNAERMALADKIVMAIVDRIAADIIRPGPKPEERECYVMAKELRDHSDELQKLVADILKVEQEE